ncbi:MAG: DUF814 domain-containing protein [Caldithrix sp.]|nr:DUF814 domain-containing protein [Caldithrix sp.]
MHKNYYLFKRQVDFIKPQVIGGTINRMFTFQKNEVVMEFSRSGRMFFLFLNIHPSLPHIILKDAFHIRKPEFQVFECLKGQTLQNMDMRPFDKWLQMHTEQYVIDTVFFGRHPNVFVHDEQNNLIDTFKSGQPALPEYGSAEQPLKDISADTLADLFKQQPAEKLITILQNTLAGINKLLARELLFRAGLTAQHIADQLSRAEINRLHRAIQNLYGALHSGPVFIYKNKDAVKRIALVDLKHLSNTEEDDWTVETFDSVNKAWDYYIRQVRAGQTRCQLENECRTALAKKHDYLQRSLQRLQEAENLQKRKADAELKGNLLLTFQQEVDPNASKVTLDNIFIDPPQPIEIKLNPSKSAVENANQYFNKFKNIDELKHTQNLRKKTLQQDLQDIEALQQTLASANDVKALQKLQQDLVQRGLIQQSGKQTETDISALKHQFHRYFLQNNWELYVGKNASNNELLTFCFAKKQDIWLHSQGVPGSHAIIRVADRNINPPAAVIEEAGRIVAAYSRAKHSETVPVQYTRVRYVQRMRKAATGVVKVQHEQVIFVKPLAL